MLGSWELPIVKIKKNKKVIFYALSLNRVSQIPGSYLYVSLGL